jgi:hypothetical protein
MKRLILVTIAVLALTVSKAQSKEDQPEFRKAA